jgi:hypothetical protein
MSVVRLWWVSLGIFAAVVGVVAALLGLIAATARSIDRNAQGIWTVGKQIAGNTVSIWMLEKTNENLVGIAGVAGSIEQTAIAIDDKLRAVAGTTGAGR